MVNLCESETSAFTSATAFFFLPQEPNVLIVGYSTTWSLGQIRHREKWGCETPIILGTKTQPGYVNSLRTGKWPSK
jgi:hypothetical protein